MAEYTNPQIEVKDKEILNKNYTIVNSILVGTTICFEGNFPEISRKFVQNGAQILVNITLILQILVVLKEL